MFSQTTEYALRAMVCLAQTPDELAAAPTLAKQTRVPANYLAKVLQQLAAAGLITGRRGVGGGYRLAKPAENITLLEIVLAMGTVRADGSLPEGNGPTDRCLRQLEHKLREATSAVTAVFRDVTLDELVATQIQQASS